MASAASTSTVSTAVSSDIPPGICNFPGVSVEALGDKKHKLHKKILEALTLAAEKGDAHAQYNLAVLYLFGKAGLEKDKSKGEELLKEAATHGHQYARYNRAIKLISGETPTVEESTEGYALLVGLVRENFLAAKTVYGFYLAIQGDNLDTIYYGIDLLRETSDYSPSQTAMHKIRYDPDLRKRYKKFSPVTLSQDISSIDALFRLATNYEYGIEGIEPDLARAVFYYEEAKKHKDATALHHITFAKAVPCMSTLGMSKYRHMKYAKDEPIETFEVAERLSKDAERSLKEASEMRDLPYKHIALYQLGYDEKHSDVLATEKWREYYRRAYEAGSVVAAYAIGKREIKREIKVEKGPNTLCAEALQRGFFCYDDGALDQSFLSECRKEFYLQMGPVEKPNVPSFQFCHTQHFSLDVQVEETEALLTFSKASLALVKEILDREESPPPPPSGFWSIFQGKVQSGATLERG